MRRQASAALTAIVAAVVLASGCGEAKTTVQGEVTLDGKPLEDGLITYSPRDGKTPAAVAKIKDGKYSVVAVPGAAQVRINSSVVIGKRKAYGGPESPDMDILGERIPNRYNVKSDLKTDIQKGENTLNWELRSK